ncbi:MAG: DNA topology modulation protein FlaR [Clostridia bacterium]|nr:DNA topology modulation protein FlaR [Clostridia bacterium]
MKIAILGFSGSGKSTLAKFLSEHYSLPLLYLDTVQFEENWVVRPQEEKEKMLAAFMAQHDSWVIDGNYTKLYQSERLEAADMIVLLCFNRFACLARALRRHRTYRGRVRESIAPGCKEKMDAEFVLWILHGGRKRAARQRYRDIQNKYRDKCTVIKNQRQLNAFYASFREN